MDKKGKLLILFFTAFVLAVVVWAVKTIPMAPPQTAPTEDSKVMKYSGNTLSEEKNGKKIWELTAETMDMDIETQNVTLTNMSGKFYAENGTVVAVKAPHGYYEQTSKNLTLDGGVDIESSDNAKLNAQQLIWTSATAILAAEGNAKISKDDAVATGNRIESSDGFEIIKVIGNAHIVKGKIAQ
jgi:LPS export ABC transporter protein LptC